MPAVETLKQANMFSGEWETRRTRNILEQLSMFSINETFEFGAQVRPYLSELPRPTLELIREDVRTPEEVERAVMRDAEALTAPMFSDGDAPEREEPDNQHGHRPPETSIVSEKNPKLSAYRALVTLVREQATTLWVDGIYRQRYYNQLPLSIQAAQEVGLTSSEISAAMQIGEFLGNQERQEAEKSSTVVFEASSSRAAPVGEAAPSEPLPSSPSLSPQSVTQRTDTREGLGAQLRQEQNSDRARHPQAKPSEVVPLHWMDRDYIQQRLPYLAEGIGRLDEDELNSLAESISEVLQETYWTMLGITLTHYLDHEQRERREGTA